MSNPFTHHIGKRGTYMALGCGLTMIAALESMYIVNRDVKNYEGRFNPYEDEGHAAMTSVEVSDAVSVPKPGNIPRLHTHPANAS